MVGHGDRRSNSHHEDKNRIQRNLGKMVRKHGEKRKQNWQDEWERYKKEKKKTHITMNKKIT